MESPFIKIGYMYVNRNHIVRIMDEDKLGYTTNKTRITFSDSGACILDININEFIRLYNIKFEDNVLNKDTLEVTSSRN